MADPRTPWSLRSSLRVVETAAKGVLLVGGALYALGFTVVAFHQLHYGIVVTGLLRAQYILAGMWLLLPLVLLALLLLYITAQVVPFVIFIRSGRWKEVPSRWKIFLLPLAYPLYLLFLLWGIGFNLEMGVGAGAKTLGFSTADWRGVAFAMGKALLVFTYLALPLVHYIEYSREGQSPKSLRGFIRENHMYAILDSAIVVGVLAAYVMAFTGQAYSRIPIQFGGGAPRDVRFLFRDQKSIPLFLEADSTGIASIPYTVVLETDRSFVVRSRTRAAQVSEFGRSEVAGILTVEPRPQK